MYKDSEEADIKGFSIKPLRIENKELGYLIIYELKDFDYNPKKDIVKFYGNYYFQQFEGNSSDIKYWNRNRTMAYYGSRMHFIRTIYSGSLKTEGFKIIEKLVSVKGKEMEEPVHVNQIVQPKDNISKTLFYKNQLLISYANPPQKIASITYGYTAPEKSAIIFSDSVTIYQNGMFEPPYSINWIGRIGDERIVDMLPLDYQPGEFSTK